MGEIEVGEYIRTKNGIIRKVETIKSGKRQFTRTIETLINGKFKPDNIVKHSKNIIDLIEVGDYVDGNEVVGFLYNARNKEKAKCRTYFGDFGNEEIKSIVTKEQFANIEYKVNT